MQMVMGAVLVHALHAALEDAEEAFDGVGMHNRVSARNVLSGAFRAVVLTPSAASGDLRLDTEIVRLQQEFGTAPSRVRFTLRAYLVQVKSRRVLASREFDASVPSASEDPYGGVLAANRAIQTVLGEVSAFCAEAARTPVVATGG